MFFGRLAEKITNPSVADVDSRIPSCVSTEVVSRKSLFRRMALSAIFCVSTGAGCRPVGMEAQGGWNGEEGVYCDADYFSVFADEDSVMSQYLATFGAKTADCYWPEDGYPVGTITSYGVDISDARVFLNSGLSSELQIAGNFLGYSFADSETIVIQPADYASFCEDGSFIVSIYTPWDPTGKSDLQIVGKLDPMYEEGQMFTYNGNTFLYDDDGSPEVVEEGAEQIPSVWESLPSQQIGEAWIGQVLYNPSDMTLSELRDLLVGGGEYAWLKPIRTH